MTTAILSLSISLAIFTLQAFQFASIWRLRKKYLALAEAHEQCLNEYALLLKLVSEGAFPWMMQQLGQSSERKPLH
jgi:hypothetical protein